MQVDPTVEPTVTGFQLLGRLGNGAMGTVYRARMEGASSDIALKVLSSEAVQQRRRFKREAEIQGKLDHPNLVKVYGSGEDGNTAWIAMELVDGGTLAGVIDRLTLLPIEFLAPALLQLASALAFLHERHVTHRDVKPANVLLSESGVLKLTDFGLARRSGLTALTQQGSRVGTLAYMSPEAVSGGDVGPPSDMYALGVLAYEMCTGVLPYDGDDLTAWLRAITVGEVPPPSSRRPEVPREIDNLVLSLLAKSPAARPTAAQACARLAVESRTAGLAEASMEGAVKQLVVDLRDADSKGPAEPSWRTAEVTPADSDISLEKPPPPPALASAEDPRLRSQNPTLALAVAMTVLTLGLVVWQSMQPKARDPQADAGECVQRRAALQAAVPALRARAAAVPALATAVARWTALAGQRPPDRGAMRAAADAAETAAAQVVAGVAAPGKTPLTTCPSRGIFALKPDGSIACDAHGAGAPAGGPLAEPERATLERALQALLLAASPDLAGCVERQRHILDALVDRGGELRIPPGLTLADLEREQPALVLDLHPPGEAYEVTEGDNRELVCSKHLSVQRLARESGAISFMARRP